MDFEEFKKIIDNVKTEDEYVEVTSKMDITSDELIRLVEQYNKQYEPLRKEIWKKERKYAIMIGIIWIVLFQILIFYLALNKIKLTDTLGLILFGILVIGGIIVLCYNSWRFNKKLIEKIENKSYNPKL